MSSAHQWPKNPPSNRKGDTSANRSEDTGFISRTAFDEACQALTSCPGLSSSDMNVDVRRDGDQNFLRIKRPLNANRDSSIYPDYTKHFHLSQYSNNDHVSSNVEEEAEDVAIYHSPAPQAVPLVEYHVLHSASYRVPVLYFFLPSLSPLQSRTVDTVYERLVPKHLHSELRDIGVMGGIGMVNHPSTDIPCFWVHPCNSAEAMRTILDGINKDISPIEYLMLWIGLVGNAVGLSLPREIIRNGRK